MIPPRGSTDLPLSLSLVSHTMARDRVSHPPDRVSYLPSRAWRVVLDAGFLRVCPIQPHFLRRICLATGSCPARSHNSSFRIFSKLYT
nr:hypothetical protein BaRGS_001184 [Batillaria attramentaria]